MLVCDLPCDVCGDTEHVKFVSLRANLDAGGNVVSVGKEIYCPEHNAGRTDTQLLRETEDEFRR